MGTYPTEKIRNLGIVAHGGAGKTSLAEAILFNTGMIDRLGRVDDGTSTMDFEPEETKRKISISSPLTTVSGKAIRFTSWIPPVTAILSVIPVPVCGLWTVWW